MLCEIFRVLQAIRRRHNQLLCDSFVFEAAPNALNCPDTMRDFVLLRTN